MIIGKHVEIVKHNEKVIYANKISGEWIRVSNEVYKIIGEIIKGKNTIEEYVNAFATQEDFMFIKKIFASLIETKMLLETEKDISVPNKIASIQLTNRCNLHCTHCCVDAGNMTPDYVELSTTEMKKVFDKLVAWDPINIMLSGGEPMIREDFEELLLYLRKRYKGNIILSTNSLLINNKNVKLLVNACQHFEISIDGVDEETCSIVRGKGVFEKVCEKVKLLKDNGAKEINLSMVFSDKNQHLEKSFYELNELLGTKPICRIFSAIGRGEVNKKMFSDKSIEEVYIPSDYLVEEYQKPFGIVTCAAGKKEIFVGYDGTIYPCPSYTSEQYILGNITDNINLESILEGKASSQVCGYIEKKLPQNMQKCMSCSVKLFCWTCPGEIQDIKTQKAFERRCKILQPVLMHRVWEQEINW